MEQAKVEQVAKRQYIPEIGKRVGLKTLADCQRITGDYNRHVMICREIDLVNNIAVCELTLTGSTNNRDGEMVKVPLSAISPPIGWQANGYTIRCAPDKVDEVLGWMKRGIVVRLSQYIGDGSVCYQPADNSGQPHWKYGEVTDTVKAEDTRELIEIVKLETEWDASIPAVCEYCNGTGVHISNPSLVEQTADTDTCQFCGVHLNFSFNEPWHEPSSRYHWHTGNDDNGRCDKVRKPGECWCCNGTGIGKRYLSSIPPKERKQVIAGLERKGWRVWYQQQGKSWTMVRETVVKRFGQVVDIDTAEVANAPR